jgi:hypothetical protein
MLYSYLTNVSIKYIELDNSNDRRREKYNQFDIIVKNPFYSSLYDLFIERFGKANRHYFHLSRFARIWKLKHAVVQIQTDLCGNELNTNMKNCMEIYQNGSLYYFSVSDLLNICKNSLLNASYSFVLTPICPKNPYTNVAFSTAILYDIYWKIRNSNYNLPVLLQLYYNTFFDETRLLYKHEPIIRDFYMKDLLRMADETILEPYIKRMLGEFYLQIPFKFDPEFPAKKLVEIMLPYLRLYFIHKYSLSGSDEKFQAYNIIKYKLEQLYKSHPTLGRKIYKQKIAPGSFFKKKTRPKFVKTFNDSYIPFHEIKLESSIFDSESESSDSDDSCDSDEFYAEFRMFVEDDDEEDDAENEEEKEDDAENEEEKEDDVENEEEKEDDDYVLHE